MDEQSAKIIKCLNCGKWERRGEPCDARRQYVAEHASPEKIHADLTQLLNGLSRVAVKR